MSFVIPLPSPQRRYLPISIPFQLSIFKFPASTSLYLCLPLLCSMMYASLFSRNVSVFHIQAGTSFSLISANLFPFRISLYPILIIQHTVLISTTRLLPHAAQPNRVQLFPYFLYPPLNSPLSSLPLIAQSDGFVLARYFAAELTVFSLLLSLPSCSSCPVGHTSRRF